MYESFVARFLEKKWRKGRNIDMLAAFTLQEEEILWKANGIGGGRVTSTDPGIWAATSRLLRQQHVGNAARSVEIDILELLKLQNVPHPQPHLGQS